MTLIGLDWAGLEIKKQVLGAFQKGDADQLTDIADNLERDSWKRWEDDILLIRRLAKAAQIAEADDDA